MTETLKGYGHDLPMNKNALRSFLSALKLDFLTRFVRDSIELKEFLSKDVQRFSVILGLNILSNILFEDRDVAAVYDFFLTYSLNPTSLLTDYDESIFAFFDVNQNSIIESGEVKVRGLELIGTISSKYTSIAKRILDVLHPVITKSVIETIFVYKKEKVGGAIESFTRNELSELMLIYINKELK